MKKFLALVLALVMVFAMSACGSSGGGSSASQSENVIESMDDAASAANGITSLADYPFDSGRKSTANSDERYEFVEYAQSMSPTEWQPYNLEDAGKAYGKYMVYEFLFDRIGTNDFIPRIGKEWTEVDDTTYVIDIYDNVYDSEGNHITASDVVFSYELNANSGYAYKFEDFGTVEATGDYTVTFHLKQPFSNLGSFAALFANVAIVSENEYDEASFSKHPVGTGPYVMTEFVTDSYCTLEARDDYWQTDELRSERAKANVQTVRIDFVTDSSMRLIMFENGTSLCDPYISASDVDSFLEGGEFAGQYNLTTYYGTQAQVILANMSGDSIMSDINMRLACWYAINTDGLVAGLGSNVTCGAKTSVSAAIGDYSEDWVDEDSYQCEYNLEKAKEYLEKAGYNGETIEILSGTYQTKKDIAQIVAEMLRQAGINTNITVVEYVLETSTVENTSGWDLHIVSGNDNDYAINAIYQVYGRNGTGSHNGVSSSYITDEEFQNKIDLCSSPEGYSVELTGEILQDVIDNAYGYGCAYNLSFIAWDKIVTNPVMPYGQNTIPLWSCCDYYLD